MLILAALALAPAHIALAGLRAPALSTHGYHSTVAGHPTLTARPARPRCMWKWRSSRDGASSSSIMMQGKEGGEVDQKDKERQKDKDRQKPLKKGPRRWSVSMYVSFLLGGVLTNYMLNAQPHVPTPVVGYTDLVRSIRRGEVASATFAQSDRESPSPLGTFAKLTSAH
ncbi:hypothetical protein T492DRAFT_854466 [Pavlovales sp. CCMP2436]|nr:hypothetical protein T492DRAFT_854466 [Pavlovales sp. CCMP2436]